MTGDQASAMPDEPRPDVATHAAAAADPLRSHSGDYQAAADAVLASLADGLGPADAALALAVLVNRAATRLHNLTRAEASARKDQPAWPAWAQLQNASRSLLLQASTCRDLAARLAGRRR
ncbi:MAG: hypothetical protein ACR2IK_14405 [Chloroflexota bacterium]